MATFETLVQDLLEAEGRSAMTDDPDDAGGLTKFGISEKAHPNVDIANLTEEKAIEIYRKDYWDRFKLGEMPEAYRRDVFFNVVNSGSAPIRSLQRALGVSVDGVVGDETLGALKNFSGDLKRTIKEGQIKRYIDIARNEPSQRKYLNGWINRAVGTHVFSGNSTDLRDMELDQVATLADQALNQHYTPPQQQEPQPLRDVRPNTEDTRGPLEGLMTGFVDNLTQLIGQRLEAPQSASQEPSEARTEPEQQSSSQKLKKSLANALSRTVEEGEQQLERTANEAVLEAEAEEAVREAPSRRNLSLVDKLAEVERKKSRRATGTRETQPPVRVNRGTMEERDDSLDPTYGIF